MKVPKSEQNSKNAALTSMHKDENHPTPGSLGSNNPPNTPGGDGGGNIKTEIKEERGDLCSNDIKKELQQNGLDSSLDDLKPTIEDIKPKIEDCLTSLTDQDGEHKGPISGMGHDVQPIPTPNSLNPNPMDNINMPPGGPPHGMPPTGPHPQQQMGSTMDGGQFMQQQSQIFVFSTSLANKAADSVRMGQYKSIRDFHLDQEGTKQFLEKQPKMQQLITRQASQQGGNPMMNMNNHMAGGMNGSKNSPSIPDNTMSTVEQWVRQQNANLEQGTFSSQPSQLNPGSLSPSGQSLASMMMEGRPPHDMQSPNSMMNNPNMFGPGMGPQGNLLQSNKVPDENLTPEQLQRREESLANLRKIQQMLFPEQRGPGGPVPGPGGPPGMGMGPNGGPGMPPNMMSSGPNMHSPNSMVSSMAGGPPMGPAGGPPMGPGGPFGPGPPPNFENLTPAQREWFKLQQEYYQDKRRKQEMERMRHFQQMQQMGMNMPAEGPPPYFPRIRGPGMPPGPMSPTSPMGPNDPQGFMMGPRRPGPMNFNGPGGPSFDPMGPIGPGPGPMGFPFGKEDMLRPPMKGGNMPMIQRAGNPEQFNADIIPPISTAGGPTKPPPPYGQSNKRKRSGEDLDDLYKKLQPAPSPQQFSYLNQFEGQELTITKQLNMAYQESSVKSPAQHINSSNPQGIGPPSQGPPSHPPPPKSQHGSQPPTPQPQPSPRPPTSNTPVPCSSSAPPPISCVASPIASTTSITTTTPPSQPQHSLSRPSSVSGTQCSSAMPPPSPLTATPHTPLNQQGGPGSVPCSQQQQLNPRLSHFDGAAPPANSTKSKESMSNITSASLASLAKGVEHLSNQMQQNMMHGGPFHNIQIQGQMSEMENQVGRPVDHPAASQHGAMPPPQNGQCSMPGDNQGQPSVNNTFVNATMSIGQVNIQSVHPGGGPGNYNATMQMQQMNNELIGPSGPNMGPNGQNMGPVGQNVGHGGPNMPPTDQMNKMPTCSQGNVPAGMHRPFPGHSPPLPTDQGMINSPGFPRTSANPVGNANVQIQAKAPNTIQYLPAHPPTSQPGQTVSAPPARKEMDMIPPRFPSPLPNMDPITAQGPTSRPKFMPPNSGPNGPPQMGPADMMSQRMGGPGMQGPMGGPMPQGGPPPMSMQQSMMMPGGGNMQQQMSGPMPYGSPGPSPMHPGPGGPSPVGHMMGGPPDMMQGGMQMQGQHMSMQPGGPMMGGPGMRPDGGMMGVPPGPAQGGYNAQFHQFQQQLYAQGRPRAMNPGGPHMGGPRMMGPGHEMMGGPMVPGGLPPELSGMMQGHPGMMGGPMGHPQMGPGPGMGGMLPGMPNMP